MATLPSEAWSLPLPAQSCPGASAFCHPGTRGPLLTRDSEPPPLKASEEGRWLTWCLQATATASYLVTADLRV